MPTIKVTKVEFVGRVKEREVIVEEENVVPWGQEAALHVVGRATPRVDGVARVTGQAVYTHDVQLPGMLIGRFLRSPYPHARLKRIDSSVAEELPGVWVVWHRGKRPPVDRLDGREVFLEELAYQGAEVAFVAAQDERIAEDALRLIEVEYEELPFAPDLPSATAEDAPLVLAGSDGNVIDPEGQVYERGSVGGGAREAEVIVEGTYTTPIAAHCCMETHGSAVRWEGDQPTVWNSTQSIYGTRSSTAEALGIPFDRVRAIYDYVGGGFGSKWGAEKKKESTR